VSEPASEPSPYKKFESFLRRLVAVPKAEIDAEAAKGKQRDRWRSVGTAGERRQIQDQAQP
jgi:hypothetical protein